MIEEELFKTFQDRYYFEIERQYKIRNNISISLSFLAVILAALFFFFQNFHILGNNVCSILSKLLFYLSFSLIVFSIYFLYRAIFGYTYGMLPKPSATLNDLKNLREYYQNPYFKEKSGEEKEKLIKSDFDNFFKDYYLEATDISIDNNNKRSKYMYLTHLFLILSLFLLILSFVPFHIEYNKYKNNIKKENSIMLSKEKENQKKPADNKPKPPPQKPNKTPLDMVKEGNDKPEKKSK